MLLTNWKKKKKDTPVTQESTRISGAWCQETRAKTKYISNYIKAEQNINLDDRYWYDSTFLNAVFNPCTSIQCYGLKVCAHPRHPWNPASLVAQRVKHLPAMQETRVQSLGREDPLEKEMATHVSTLAWKIPQMEDPSRLQFMGLQRVGHDWVTSLSLSWNPYVKAPIPDVTVLGDRAYEEVMRIKWGHKDGTLLWQWWWCCKMEKHWNSQSWPLQDTARRQPYSSQKESSHLELNLLAPDLELPAFKIVRK